MASKPALGALSSGPATRQLSRGLCTAALSTWNPHLPNFPRLPQRSTQGLSSHASPQRQAPLPPPHPKQQLLHRASPALACGSRPVPDGSLGSVSSTHFTAAPSVLHGQHRGGLGSSLWLNGGADGAGTDGAAAPWCPLHVSPSLPPFSRFCAIGRAWAHSGGLWGQIMNAMVPAWVCNQPLPSVSSTRQRCSLALQTSTSQDLRVPTV